MSTDASKVTWKCRVGMATACGPRLENQDALAACPEWGVFVLADGMGGRADGRETAEAAVRAVARQAESLTPELRDARGLPGAAVVEAFERVMYRANQAVRRDALIRHAPERPPRSGSTLTVLAVVDATAYCAHIGDSRVYRVRGEEAVQLTMDHSVAAARVRRGGMSAAEAARSPLRHRLYQAVGLSDELQVDLVAVGIEPGDRLVLCSDGLWGQVPGAEIGAAVVGRSPQEAADRLLLWAEKFGLVDNTTVMVVEPVGFVPTPDLSSVLGTIDLFAALAPTVLRRLAPYFERRHLEPGEELDAQRDFPTALVVWASGSFERIPAGGAGAVVQGPAVLGVEAFCSGRPSDHTVRARSASWVHGLGGPSFQKMLQQEPRIAAELALSLGRNLAQGVSDRGGR